MAMTFQEFLQEKADPRRLKERRERRAEWVAAVERLLGQMRAWLAESDPGEVLEIVPFEILRVEPEFGAYQAPTMKIRLGDKAVQVTPVGRGALGTVDLGGGRQFRAEGRVDVEGVFERVILYRTLEAGECWYALDDQSRATPLDRSRFERILQDLLS